MLFFISQFGRNNIVRLLIPNVDGDVGEKALFPFGAAGSRYLYHISGGPLLLVVFSSFFKVL